MSETPVEQSVRGLDTDVNKLLCQIRAMLDTIEYMHGHGCLDDMEVTRIQDTLITTIWLVRGYKDKLPCTDKEIVDIVNKRISYYGYENF